MQHDHVLKKLNFDLLTPSPRVVGEGVCRQNICLHVAAFRDSSKFNMQHDYVLKKLNFIMWTLSEWREVGGSTGKMFATTLLHLWFPLI